MESRAWGDASKGMRLGSGYIARLMTPIIRFVEVVMIRIMLATTTDICRSHSLRDPNMRIDWVWFTIE